jgi:hypothetical protein
MSSEQFRSGVGSLTRKKLTVKFMTMTEFYWAAGAA